MGNAGESVVSPIIWALSYWPSDRIPDPRYWEFHFRHYETQSVVEAIKTLRMRSDPYQPTTDQVEAILKEFGHFPKPVAGSGERKISHEVEDTEGRLRELRAGQRRSDARDKADNDLVAKMSDEAFNEVAGAYVASLAADVRPTYEMPMSPSKVEQWGKRPLGRFQSIRSAVAEKMRSR